jgi:RNA polymerase sigma factor (sigma-70 family)
VNATLARITRLTGDQTAAGDGPLLDAFLSGDQGAFAVLVRRHAGLVFATCRRVLRHQQDTEDAFQATFLVLARRAADVWPREAVASWLFGVAHRVALKARAVRGRRTVREQPLEDAASTKPVPVDFDLVEAVHRIVCKLPELYRAAVVACDLEGLSRKEAAERLGWSEGTLSGRLARARELLARRFRRTGLALPAGGLGAVFTTAGTVSAATVQTTIDLATGTAVGAPAPVAALTEGVVRSMGLFKFKVLTVAVFAACVLGFGAFTATGAGPGEGTGASGPPTRTQTQGPTAPVAVKAEQPKPLPPAKIVTDRDRLQGTWRVVSLTEGGKTTPTNPKDPWVIEVSRTTLKMPYLEGGSSSSGSSGTTGGSSGTSSTTGGTAGTSGGWKQKEFGFTVDESQTPRGIELIANRKSVAHGIYEFTAPATTCATCHQPPNEPLAWKLGLKPDENLLGLCVPGLKKVGLTLRLALSIDGSRPTKFGGDGVIVFELKRSEPRDDEHEKLTAAAKRVAEALRAATDAKEKERLLEELARLQKEREALVLREEQRRALIELRQAEAYLEQSKAQVAVAQAEVERAVATLQVAKQRLAAAEKALAETKKGEPAHPEGAAFTVHVRPLTEAEKMIRVKATGKETVLEGLAYATEAAAFKSGEVNVWVVRCREVLPVDLPAILKGDPKTNVTLKPGDQLFVQVKPAK